MWGKTEAVRDALHHLELRRKTWFVILDIPAELRNIIGHRRIVRTTGCHDLAGATRIRAQILPKLQNVIVQARRGNQDGEQLAAMLGTRHRQTIAAMSRIDVEPESLRDVPIADIVDADGCDLRQRYGAKAVRVYQDALAGRAIHPAITFQDASRRYLDAHKAAWKSEQHRGQWESSIRRYVLPTLGDLDVSRITTDHVLSVLNPIWQPMPETASRIRGRLESILDYCTAQNWREGDNPARWRGHMQHLLAAPRKLATRQHFAALPWQDVPALMGELAGIDTPASRALRWLILTATRSAETIGATWTEIDVQAASWTIPAGRMKAGREHTVPLSPAALALLGEPTEGYLFKRTGTRPLARTALGKRLDALRPGVTPHGMRSAFRDWAGDGAKDRTLAEMSLAHRVAGETEGAYARSNLLQRRRLLMQEWAEFITS